MADFEVSAELLINAGRAQAGLNALSSRLSGFSSTLRGTNGLLGGAVGQMVAFGATYVGVGALMNGFASLTREALDFTRQVEGAQIGIATMVSAFQDMPFEQSEVAARGMYQEIQRIAITTSATSSELLDTFQVLYAGMASAGMDTNRQMNMLAGTATAAAAFMSGDMAQTSRDMSLLMEGRAGAQVKLWNRVKGIIGMTAEQWNQMTAPERAERMERMLTTPAMQTAAERYGKSFAGVLSTAQDIREQLSGAFFSPAMDRFKAFLDSVNMKIIKHREKVTAFVVRAGAVLGRFVDYAATRAYAAIGYITANWDRIVMRAQEAWSTLQHWAPIIREWGETFVKFRLGAYALGVALQGGAWLASGLSAISSMAAMLGATGVGAAAAVAGAAGATAAGGAAAAGGWAAFSAGITALAPIVAGLAAAALALWQGWGFLTEQFEGWAQYWVREITSIFGGVWSDLQEIFAGLWSFVQPIFGGAGGGAIALLLNGLRLLGGAIRLVLLPFRLLAKFLSWLSWLPKMLATTFGALFTVLTVPFGELGSAIHRLIGMIDDDVAHARPGVEERVRRYAERRQEAVTPQTAAAAVTPQTAAAEVAAEIPTERSAVHNDFRGSKITVEQTFREADPDRVAVRMIEDLQRFAEQRVQSRFAFALTR